jgi:hypothetical protein
MADKSPDGPPEPSDALKRLLDQIGEAISDRVRGNEGIDERNRLINDLTHVAADRDGVMLPISINREKVPANLRATLDGILMEQSKGSLFLAQMPKDHPYRAVFSALSESWMDGAMAGAMQIAEHRHENGEPMVGPREFGAAWASIAVTAMLGGVRFGQENPDAFKGLEGIKEGEIDEAISDLVKWVEDEAARQGLTSDQEDENKED